MACEGVVTSMVGAWLQYVFVEWVCVWGVSGGVRGCCHWYVGCLVTAYVRGGFRVARKGVVTGTVGAFCNDGALR